MTHNLPNFPTEPVFRPAIDALQKVWKVLKSDNYDVMSMSKDEISAYYDLIDFCEAIVEHEVPNDYV